MKIEMILYLILFIIGIPITIWALIMSNKKSRKKTPMTKIQKQTGRK